MMVVMVVASVVVMVVMAVLVALMIVVMAFVPVVMPATALLFLMAGAAHFLQRTAGEHGAQCGLGGEHSPEGLNIVGGVGVIHPEPDQINQGTGIRTGIGPGIRPGDRGLHQREQCQPSSLQPASRIPTEACRLLMEQRRLMGDAG